MRRLDFLRSPVAPVYCSPVGAAKAGVVGAKADAIPDSGVSRWTFDDNDVSSSTISDIWGTYEADIYGDPISATGANKTYNTNEARDFDGTDDAGQLGATTLGFADNDAISIAAWIYSNEDGPGCVLSLTNRRLTLTVGDTVSYGSVGLRGYDGSSHVVEENNLTNTWYHVVGTYDGGGNATLYIDGSSVDINSSFGYAFESSDSGIAANTASNSTAQEYDGRIDDMRVYSKELSSSEVSNLYNNGDI